MFWNAGYAKTQAMMHQAVGVMVLLPPFYCRKEEDSMGKKRKKRNSIGEILKGYRVPKNLNTKFKKKNTDPFGIQKSVQVYDLKELHIDQRYYVNFNELCHRAYDHAYFTDKKKRKHVDINVYPIIQGNQKLRVFGIYFQDISYIILEISDKISFPSITSINGRGRNKKRETAICEIGSSHDSFSDLVIKRDLKLIETDSDIYQKDLIGYRIKKTHFEKLMNVIIANSFPSLEGARKRSMIYEQLMSNATPPRIFFRYIVGGYVVMKNGDGYRLGETEVSF